MSLDAFRGVVIAFMVLVNNGGPENYAQLEHSRWNGWTLTDFVFPSFLWMLGVSITLSLGKRLSAGVSRSIAARQVLRRSAILIALGIFIYLYPDFNFATMRFPGVLQRIGICYLMSSLIYMSVGVRGQILWIVGLLAVYWALMTFVPVPGFGSGHFDLAGNFSHYVDRILFGKHNYHSGDWDPEGSVSTLPAIASTLFGVIAGRMLSAQMSLKRRLACMGVVGVALVAAGLMWSPWMPINKKIWTDSFALLNAGLDFILFAGFAWIVDQLAIQQPFQPFVIMGRNALAIYVAAELLSSTFDWLDIHDWAYDHLFRPIASPLNASLLYAISFTLLMYLLAYLLYRRNWFWRI